MILRRRVISYLHMTHTLHRPKNYSEPHAAAAAAPAASFSPANRTEPEKWGNVRMGDITDRNQVSDRSRAILEVMAGAGDVSPS